MSESVENIKIRNDRPSGTIVINRPDKKNSLTRELVRMLTQSLRDLLLEASVKAVIVTGSGDVFCAGSDLLEISETSESEQAMEQWQSDVEDVYELLQTILTYPKPVIAAVNGPAVGLGAALFLASDIVIASKTATVCLPEAKLGLSNTLTTPLLAFRSNPGIASSLVLSGRTIDAQHANNYGLFHELVDFDLVWAKAHEVARQCAEGARESHQMNKRMLNETIVENLMTQLSIGAAETASARTTRAGKEGVQAFLEKRAPDWESIYKNMDE